MFQDLESIKLVENKGLEKSILIKKLFAIGMWSFLGVFLNEGINLMILLIDSEFDLRIDLF